MVNYRGLSTKDSVDVFGYVRQLQPGDILLRLTRPASGTGSITMHSVATGANYQVPTGKKTKIVAIDGFNSINAAAAIRYSDDVDADTNAVVMFSPANTASLFDFPFISISAPASKYINGNGGGSNCDSETQIYALEENA